MSAPRKLKKSESLEIRIPHPTKQAFMARCQAEGRSASEALRAFIDRELDAPTAAARRARGRLIAGALIAAAVGAAAVPSLARPSPEAEFRRLDRDHDGRVTAVEFRALDANRDGVISLSEYRR